MDLLACFACHICDVEWVGLEVPAAPQNMEGELISIRTCMSDTTGIIIYFEVSKYQSVAIIIYLVLVYHRCMFIPPRL